LNAKVYLDKLLERYAHSFDIHRPFSIYGEEYPAYGYYFSLSEKYVVSPKANLWSVRTYEHILFLHEEKMSEATVKKVRELMEQYMEPELVRKKKSFPEKDHMVSYLTVCVLSDKSPDQAVREAVARFRFSKNYLLTVRGHSEGHLICADLEKEQVFCNRPARRMLKTYEQNFSDARGVQEREVSL
jgi:hypothetical protein